MKEKTKNRILIVVVIILFIALLVCIGIIFNEKSEENNENIERNEEIINTTNNDEYDGTVVKQIQLNGEELNVKLSYANDSIIENNEDSKLYAQEYNLMINDKNITGVDEGAKYINSNNEINGELFTLDKIKDTTSNSEYLLLQLYRDSMSGGPTINVYIINCEEGKIITKLIDDKNSSALFLKEKMEMDEEGTYITNEQAQLKMEILDDSIINYEYNTNLGKIEKKIYTIDNGTLNIEVDIIYDQEEIYVVGKSW